MRFQGQEKEQIVLIVLTLVFLKLLTTTNVWVVNALVVRLFVINGCPKIKCPHI